MVTLQIGLEKEHVVTKEEGILFSERFGSLFRKGGLKFPPDKL
jgi:hypothetical protein